MSQDAINELTTNKQKNTQSGKKTLILSFVKQFFAYIYFLSFLVIVVLHFICFLWIRAILLSYFVLKFINIPFLYEIF